MTQEYARSCIRGTLLIICLLTWPLASSAAAATVPGNYPTIQAAINAVQNGTLPSGTTIDVAPGTYSEGLVVSPSSKSFTVRGTNPATTIVDAVGKNAPALTVNAATGTVVFSGITFRNGAPPAAAGGGFVITSSSPAFFNCIFESNTASGGAGGALFMSNATFTGCIIHNNTARGSGGGVLMGSGSRPVFTNSDIINNVSGTAAADGVGGGVDARNSSPTFRGSHINGNTSKFAGGGIYHGGQFGSPYGVSTLVLEDSDVSVNVSSPFSAQNGPAEGGGIHIEDNAVATLTRVHVVGNRANSGGGINAYRARYDVLDSTIDGNQALNRTDGGVQGPGLGGGIYASSTADGNGPASVVNLTGTLVRNSVAVTGGGIVVTGDTGVKAILMLASSTVDNNRGQSQGGGILISNAALTATNSLIIRNTVSGGGSPNGGGLDITTNSTANISGTTFANNTAGQFGGGIFMFSGANSLTMSGSRVYANTAAATGGGLFIGDAAGIQSGTIGTSIIADNLGGTGQINEEGCVPGMRYQNNTIMGVAFSGCAPGGRATNTDSVGPPRFAHFLTTPPSGTSTTLAWSVARAASVTIAGVGTWTSPTNSPTGTVDVTPASSTTYSLTATATAPNGGNYAAVTAGFTFVPPPSPPPPPPPTRSVDGDFDGDRKADITVYRPSNGTWYILKSGTGFTGGAGYAWGVNTDLPVRGDFDGDGKADISVYRPSSGHWFILKSSTNFTTSATYQWGTAGDLAVPGDYDGDGKTDIAIYRPSNGTWYTLTSSSGFTAGTGYAWGVSTDLPMPGDYDGDGKTDVAVYRPSSGHWFVLKSSTNFTASATYQWGTAGDTAVPGDYDGDGRTDLAIYRPSVGTWYTLLSSTGFTQGTGYAWGASSDVPVPGDYDGDGKTDVAVYRSSTANWFILKSTTNYTTQITYQWGTTGDIPVLKGR